MPVAKRILIVEDERDLADIMGINLRKAGYDVELVHDGRAALSMISQNPPDVVVLDLMLPGLTGEDLIRAVRTEPATASLPVLMVTAKATEENQVAGLTLGADDYITKPFSMKVLLARVEALMRRTATAAPRETDQVLVGPVGADLAAHRITVDGQEIKLTLTEFKLLVALLQFPGRVLSRNDLISRVMGPGIVITTRTIDVHIAAIRKKLGHAGGMIRTIRGVGYQLTETAESPQPMA